MRVWVLLLFGFMLGLGVQAADPAWAGGSRFGFQAGHHGFSGHHGFTRHKSRVDRSVHSKVHNRMHSIMRKNRQKFLSRLNSRTPSQGTHKHFHTHTQKQDRKFDRGPRLGTPVHHFGLKHKVRGGFGFRGHDFRRRGTFVPGVGVQPFGTVPGMGVFNQGFFPFGGGFTTPSTGRSEFSQRIFEKTQGILFKDKLHRPVHVFSSVEGGMESPPKPPTNKPDRSHRDLKRMKDGKLVFSDYGGRIVRDRKIGPDNRR